MLSGFTSLAGFSCGVLTSSPGSLSSLGPVLGVLTAIRFLLSFYGTVIGHLASLLLFTLRTAVPQIFFFVSDFSYLSNLHLLRFSYLGSWALRNSQIFDVWCSCILIFSVSYNCYEIKNNQIKMF